MLQVPLATHPRHPGKQPRLARGSPSPIRQAWLPASVGVGLFVCLLSPRHLRVLSSDTFWCHMLDLLAPGGTRAGRTLEIRIRLLRTQTRHIYSM